jgi:hypothetical protein
MLKISYAGILKDGDRALNLLLFPIPQSNVYLFLTIAGKSNEDNKFLCKVVTTIPEELIDEFIKHEAQFFGEDMSIIEQIPCMAKKVGYKQYEVIPNKEGRVIKGRLLLSVYDEKKRLYILRGKITLPTHLQQNQDLSLGNKIGSLISTAIRASGMGG